MRYYRLLPKLKDACGDSSETGESKKNENSSPTTPPKSPDVGATVGKADNAVTPKKRGRPAKTNGGEQKKPRGRQRKTNVNEDGEDKVKPTQGRKRKTNVRDANEEEYDEQEGKDVNDMGEDGKAELKYKQEGLRESKKMKTGHAGSSETEEELITYM